MRTDVSSPGSERTYRLDPPALPRAGPPGGPLALAVKRVLDFALALVLLVLTAPLMLATLVLVKLTSPGPGLYRQTRLGRGGRIYLMYKIRTMYHNCEARSGARWSPPGDPRVTRLGRFLRVSHLDELPQLWNVLRGEMSLVGPRPERPEFLPALEQDVPCYRERLAVRPGLTGLAQVQLPADTDTDAVRRKVACDLYYIRSLSIGLDVRILLATVGHLLRVPFRLTRALLRVPCSQTAWEAYRALASSVKQGPHEALVLQNG